MADGPIMLQKDNTFTKLFVGGLPYHTTNETLRKYFLEFGEIEEAVVIHDRVSQKSKGYGFVTMKDKLGAEKACQDPNPIIDGRKANVNLAYLGAKPKPHAHPTSPLSVFPGTLPPPQRTDSPTGGNGLFTTGPAPQNSPPGLPLPPPPGLFIPSPPPPTHFYQDSPPFSPPLYNHIMVPPYFNGNSPPFGYLPPSPHQLLQNPHNPPTFIPQMVPFNAAN